MNKSFALAVMALAVSGITLSAANAQFGGLGSAIKKEAKKQKKKAKKKAVDEADRAVTNAVRGDRSSSSASSGGSLGTPASTLTSYTQCAGLAMTNVMIGTYGSYHFQQGFSKEKRSGFINRRPATMTGCILNGGLQKDEILYFEVDNASYKKTKRGSNWKLQCVRSNNPGGGTVPLFGSNGTSDKYLSDKDLKLHCGNDQGVSDCATGTNSKRSQAYGADMRKRGKYGVSFLAFPLPTNQIRKGSQARLYCQYHNRDTGKSLVAFEMMAKHPHD